MIKKLLIVNTVFISAIVAYTVYRDYIAPLPEKIRREIKIEYGVPMLKIPAKVDFAGEPVPLNDPDVKERLDREMYVNTFWHSNTIFILKRGNRWLPQIEQVMEKYGIPSDLKYLTVIESDLMNKTSPSHAVGFWQLLKGTAKDYGLQVDNEVDERYDPIKSTVVACQYLKKAHDKFGTWTAAAASYNIGMRGLQRTIDKQGVKSYYELLLGEETSRYVFRAIAVKLIFEDPEKFGFYLGKKDLYQQEDLREVPVDKSIKNLREFAFDQGINYKLLKRYNPWMRKNTLTVRHGKTYDILIPKNPPSIEEEQMATADSVSIDSLDFSDEDFDKKDQSAD